MKRIALFALMVLVIIPFLIAAGKKTTATTPEFAVTPVLPSNQKQADAGYFDLQVDPGQQENLQLRISNLSDQVQTYTIAVNPAYTTDSGAIAFDRAMPPLNQDARRLNTLISGPEKVSVPAKTEKLVTYILKAPSQHFIGVISGGFYVSPENDSSTNKSASGVSFTNRFAIGITTILRQDFKTPNPPLLAMTKAGIGTINHYAAVQATISNPSGNQFGDITSDYALSKTGTKKALITGHFVGQAVAPHSLASCSMTANSWLVTIPSNGQLNQATFLGQKHLPFTIAVIYQKTPYNLLSTNQRQKHLTIHNCLGSLAVSPLRFSSS
ncbi:hypothetical protein FAM22280_01305 [Lacticaseibacillus paracasei]|nr:hypothetical protein FAM22280_01305 [Lacticaseibacillus paracasei]